MSSPEKPELKARPGDSKRFVGLARKVSERSDKLPAEKIGNRIVKINPAFTGVAGLTFGELGEAADVLFLGGPDSPYRLESSAKHLRTGILSRQPFYDKSGRWYRDLDQKGGGSSSKTTPLGKRYGDDYFGLAYLTEAELEWEESERDIELGIRSSRCVLITRLEELIWPNPDKPGEYRKVPIKELKDSGHLAEGFDPVILLRAFGTKERPRMEIGSLIRYQRAALTDARNLVRDELKLTASQFSWMDYLNWYAKTLGINLGRLHGAKKLHQNLAPKGVPANVTLDCRLTDQATQALDQSRIISHDDAMNMDVHYAKQVLEMLRSNMIETGLSRYVPGKNIDLNMLNDLLEAHYISSKKEIME